MDMASTKIIFAVIFSFKVAFVNSLILLLLPIKQTNKYKEKFVILQSIGILVIKNRETRAVIYTCRYSSGHFNPYNSAKGLN